MSRPSILLHENVSGRKFSLVWGGAPNASLWEMRMSHACAAHCTRQGKRSEGCSVSSVMEAMATSAKWCRVCSAKLRDEWYRGRPGRPARHHPAFTSFLEQERARVYREEGLVDPDGDGGGDERDAAKNPVTCEDSL